MPRCALINPQNQIDRISNNIDPTVKTKTGWKWLPVVTGVYPTYDPDAEKVLGPTYTIGATQVDETWSKINLTAQEISDLKDNSIETLRFPWDVLAKILLNHENRIRALESKAAITMLQFKTGIKALL